MSARRVLAFALLGLALGGCGRPGTNERPTESAMPASDAGFPWALDTLWDDGRAEVSRYVGTTIRYDAPRATEARIVVVKEDVLNDQLVKSDRGAIPGRTTEALKQIATIEFTTGTYGYRLASTTFFFRRSLEPFKEVASTYDGCGVTTARVGPAQGRLMHSAHSYWEGEADRMLDVTWPLDGRPRVWFDALPVWLRGALDSGAVPERVWLLPTQMSGRSPASAAVPVAADLVASDGGGLKVPAGRVAATRLVEVRTAADTSRWWFDAVAPHVLVKFESRERTLELAKTLRLDYWNHRAPGDEALLR